MGSNHCTQTKFSHIHGLVMVVPKSMKENKKDERIRRGGVKNSR